MNYLVCLSCGIVGYGGNPAAFFPKDDAKVRAYDLNGNTLFVVY